MARVRPLLSAQKTTRVRTIRRDGARSPPRLAGARRPKGGGRRGRARLARVDYLANRVSEDVARVVQWALHDQAWLARAMVHTLQSLDEMGGALIALVVWLVEHAS